MAEEKTWTNKIGKLPAGTDEFLSVYTAIGETPSGAAVCLIIALIEYSKNEETGKKMLSMLMDPSRLVKRGDDIKELFQSDLKFISMQSKGKEYMFRSYISGTSPENSYEIEKMPAVFEFSSNKYSDAQGDNKYKLFVKSSGAASPRPVTLSRQADGYWKVFEYSSLLLDIKTPLR
ncbi:hypothetical protein JW890_04195 [candidate division WOR-3 bacterium]|nr:hypothetical protein [candidate division WOR-3 bacterium]